MRKIRFFIPIQKDLGLFYVKIELTYLLDIILLPTYKIRYSFKNPKSLADIIAWFAI